MFPINPCALLSSYRWVGGILEFSFWDPIFDRVFWWLDGLKKAYMSLDGRITLVQSCLSYVWSHFLSILKSSIKVAHRIEGLKNDIYDQVRGKGKKSPCLMVKVCKQKSERGGRKYLWGIVVNS